MPPYQTFTTQNFPLESGPTLPHATLAYATSGRRTTAPPILTCTAFSANHDDLAYLRAAGAALGPNNRWIIHTEMLGNGRSTSPSNSPADFAGPNFPPLSIRDNVRLQKLLLDHLGVNHIYAVIGASMGGQQALQWTVSYPEIVQRAAVLVGSAKATPHVQLFLNALANCIRSDPDFNDGHYTQPPLDGLSRMSECWAPWAFSPTFFSHGDYQKYEDTRADSPHGFLAKWRTRYHEKDANDLLCHMAMWASHDIGRTPNHTTTADTLQQINTPILFLPCATDAYFNVQDIQAEADLIPNSQLTIIHSNSGHAAGFGRSESDRSQINTALRQFLS